MDNETWLLEKGDKALELKANGVLVGIMRVIYCLWVVDYSIRNGGDISNVDEMYPNAPSELRGLSVELSLPELAALMVHYGKSDFADIYMNHFDQVVNQIRKLSS